MSDNRGAIRVDSLITAAARALAAGDPFGALNHVALRDDPPALALRGIAIAQLGDLARAKLLLKRAATGFGAAEPLARARCIVALAEIAFVSRDLDWSAKQLDAASAVLDAHGDRVNAAHARLLETRRLLLVGRLDDAERLLAALDPATLPPATRAAHELAVAGIAMRRLRTRRARAALARATLAARASRSPGLVAEVESATASLDAPAARAFEGGEPRTLRLADVEVLYASSALVVDALRNVVRRGGEIVPLATRPVLFELARALGAAWPGDVPRGVLLERAFGARFTDESHRARLRVEIGRLRRALRSVADVTATPSGFVLAPRGTRRVVVLARPGDEDHADVLALLADGEAWSSSALALALGASQRTVQRALDTLAAEGKAQAYGRGRARRWVAAPLPGIATTLLLPAPLPW